MGSMRTGVRTGHSGLGEATKLVGDDGVDRAAVDPEVAHNGGKLFAYLNMRTFSFLATGVSQKSPIGVT